MASVSGVQVEEGLLARDHEEVVPVENLRVLAEEVFELDLCRNKIAIESPVSSHPKKIILLHLSLHYLCIFTPRRLQLFLQLVNQAICELFPDGVIAVRALPI